jgi:hypothetical protein
MHKHKVSAIFYILLIEEIITKPIIHKKNKNKNKILSQSLGVNLFLHFHLEY